MKKVPILKVELQEVKQMIPSAQRTYNFLRNVGMSHIEAKEQLEEMAQWGELEGVKSPLGSGTREEEELIKKQIAKRWKK